MMLTLDTLSPEQRMARDGVVTINYSRPNGAHPPEGFRPNGGPGKPRKRFAQTKLAELSTMDFDPLRWAIKGYVAEGLSVLAGRQKLGKTWLALDWAIAVGTGGVAMNSIPVEQGDVLYIDLENGLRRIKRRLETLFPSGRFPDLSRIDVVTESPNLDENFIEELDRWRQSVVAPKLVVIDVLQRIKPAGKLARNAYENDYSAMAELQQWATGHGIAVVALHHTRKGGADDPLEALSGSNGLSACADATLVLDKTGNGTSLYVRGRDVEETDTALRFDGGMWFLLGDAADVRRTDERSTVLAALAESDEPMSPKDIMLATGVSNRNAIDLLLFKMKRAGEVQVVSRGRYGLPGKIYDPGKIGKKERLEDENPAFAGDTLASTPGKIDETERLAERLEGSGKIDGKIAAAPESVSGKGLPDQSFFLSDLSAPGDAETNGKKPAKGANPYKAAHDGGSSDA